MNNECDGCHVYPTVGVCFWNDVEGCPCKNCIVKVMCTETCADLNAHDKKRDHYKKIEMHVKPD